MYTDLLFDQLKDLGLTHWLDELKQILSKRLSNQHHGDFDKWQAALKALPDVTPSVVHLSLPAIEVGIEADLSPVQHEQLTTQLQVLHPWRKGPFEIFGHYIDTEWRSDWKWDRLKQHIQPLSGRSVLDIGCGSGYHCWRMRGDGADKVIGIDPTMLFVMQYFCLQNYIQEYTVNVLPLSIDDLPEDMSCFDTVFSMGLLYHRRDPLVHLNELKTMLMPGGELVLETLVVDDGFGDELIPDGRYAQMRNVWSVPSVKRLEEWLDKTGYMNIRCVDVTKTTTEEQRSTDWMQFQSLKDFLDPDDFDKTIEGYPAPRRAIVLANK